MKQVTNQQNLTEATGVSELRKCEVSATTNSLQKPHSLPGNLIVRQNPILRWNSADSTGLARRLMGARVTRAPG